MPPDSKIDGGKIDGSKIDGSKIDDGACAKRAWPLPCQDEAREARAGAREARAGAREARAGAREARAGDVSEAEQLGPGAIGKEGRDAGDTHRREQVPRIDRLPA